MQHYVGLDVSMEATSICIVDENNSVVFEGVEASEPKAINTCLRELNLDLKVVGLESGSMSNWLVSEMLKLGLPAICIDSRQMAALLSTQINKTDRNDAVGIAKALRSGYYREVPIKSDESVRTKVLLTSRKQLVRQRTMVKNNIRGILKAYGIRIYTAGKKDFCKEALKCSRVNAELAITVDSLVAVFSELDKQIARLEEHLEKLAKNDKDIKLLTTVPGVGLITALSFKSALGDPKRFKKSRDVAAYFGLTPKQYSSGESERLGGISKYGDGYTRTLLVEAGNSMLTRVKLWSKPKAWGMKLMRKKGNKKASVAIGRKLAVIMHRMLITDKAFVPGELKEEAPRPTKSAGALRAPTGKARRGAAAKAETVEATV